MPRAFCPECGSEVPVDTDGVCHVGHVIDLSTANVRADGSDEAGGTTAPADPNEPEPWVASVDTTTLGGYTPPPDADAVSPAPAPAADEPAADDLSGVSGAADLPLPPSAPASPPPVMRAEPDEPPYEPAPDVATFDLGSSEDLAQAAAEAAAYSPEGTGASQDDDAFEFSQTIEDASDGNSLGWSPPTQSPIAGAPIPPPAPVDPPAPATGETLSGEFDLDDLEAAVSELTTDPTPVPAPVESTPPPARAAESDDDDLDVLSAFDEPEPTAPAADLPAPAAPTREIPPLAPPSGEPAPPAVPAAEAPPAETPAPTHRLPAPDPGPDQDQEDVDLSNFTAKSGGSSGGGGLKGLFRRR